MATLTIRLPDDKHERLRLLARRRRISMNKLVNEALLAALARLAIRAEMSTVVLAQSDAETRIGRALDRYDVPFFYRQPRLIYDQGQHDIWRPTYTLPTYDALVVEYADPNSGVDYAQRQSVYRFNGIQDPQLHASLFLPQLRQEIQSQWLMGTDALMMIG